MDPNIQVAFISVLATLITTAGVVAVAIINNRKERTQTADVAVDAALDEKDILGRMLSLINENERKEATITTLKEEISQLKAENTALRLVNRQEEGGP